MNWKEFEQQIKTGASGYESPIDSERLWLAIQQKKRRRRLLFWWLYGGMGALLLCISVFFIYTQKDTNSAIATGNNISATAPIQDKAVGIDDSFGSSPYTPVVAPSGSVAPTAKEAAALENANAPSFVRAHTPARTNNASKEGKNPSSGALEGAKAQGLVSVKGRAQGRQAPLAYTVHPSNTSGQIITSDTGNKSVMTTGIDQSKAVSEGKTKALAEQYLSDNARPRYPSIWADSSITGPIPMVLALLPLVPMPIARPTPAWNFEVFPRKVQEKKENPQAPQYWLGAHASLGFWGISRTILQDTSNNQLSFENLEKLETAQGKFGIVAPLGKHWNIGIGLGYSSHNSIFRFDTSWVDPQMPAEASIHFANGSKADTTVYYRTVSHRKVRQYNHIRAFQVPVEIGWAPVQMGRHWAISPYLGAQLNFAQRGNGKVMDSGQNLIDGPFSSQYQKRFSMSASTGCHLIWSYSRTLQFLLSPYGSLDLTNRAVQNKEKFWQAGMGIGIRKALK